MYIEQIVEEARDLLGDNSAPYLWTETEMLRYYKNAINDFCRETFMYTDESTEDVCYVYLLPNVHTYTVSDLVVAVNIAHLETNKSPVRPISLHILQDLAYDWKSTTGTPYRFVQNSEVHKIRVYPYYPSTQAAYFAGSSNVTFAVTANTITVAAGGFTAAGFAEDDHIVISGTSSNDGDYTLASVSDTVLTTNEDLATEALTSADIRVIVDTMIMNVSRLPDMSALTISTWDTTSPPIPSQWHSKIVPGIIAQAFGKRDTETYDAKEMDRYEIKWNAVKQEAKESVIMFTHDFERFNPHPGAI